jgi:hypothetical protein
MTMIDPKKVSVKSAPKTPTALKSVAASAKPKVKAAAKPLHHSEASIAAEPVAALVAVPTPIETLRVDPAPAAPEIVPVTAPVEAITSVVAPKAAALRQAMGEAVSASAHGALAVNDKVIEALQTQSHAALDLWRTAASTPHLSDVFRLQSQGARQAYETASAQWKDIAETTAHWFTKTVEPLSSAISDLKR